MHEALALVATRPALFAALAGLFGLFIGSFLNVVIHRLPRMMERRWLLDSLDALTDCKLDDATRSEARSRIVAARAQALAEADKLPPIPADDAPFNLAVPRSRCPHCERPIKAIENVPLLSWLVLRGRCAGCGARISARYPAIELASAALAAAVAWHFGFGVAALGAMALAFALLALAVIDYDETLLPDSITLPFLWLGLLFNYAGVYTTLPNAVIGAVAGYLILWLVFHAFRLVTGKEGMGYGDFKLLAMLGAWLGADMLPLVVLLSALVGAIVGVALIRFRGMDRGRPIPFGPFLAGAGLIALLFGDELMHAWLATSAA